HPHVVVGPFLMPFAGGGGAGAMVSLLFGLVFAAWITRRSGRRCFPATRSCRTSRLTSAGAGPRCAGRVSGINGQAGRAGRRPGSAVARRAVSRTSRMDSEDSGASRRAMPLDRSRLDGRAEDCPWAGERGLVAGAVAGDLRILDGLARSKRPVEQRPQDAVLPHT